MCLLSYLLTIYLCSKRIGKNVLLRASSRLPCCCAWTCSPAPWGAPTGGRHSQARSPSSARTRFTSLHSHCCQKGTRRGKLFLLKTQNLCKCQPTQRNKSMKGGGGVTTNARLLLPPLLCKVKTQFFTRKVSQVIGNDLQPNPYLGCFHGAWVDPAPDESAGHLARSHHTNLHAELAHGHHVTASKGSQTECSSLSSVICLITACNKQILV